MRVAVIVCLVAGPMTVAPSSAPSPANHQQVMTASLWDRIKNAVKWYIDQTHCDIIYDRNCLMYG